MTSSLETPALGSVALVGAGPGDPGLITVRGREYLEACQAVVYDRLAHPRLLELVPESAERVYVGKKPGGHAATQDEIHEHLLRLARRGLRVVRLKGGDPFVFGRGGEEALVLREAGIPYQVVPGVTSGIAALAYAGIPVTQRNMAVGVSFFTGHEAAKSESQIDLSSLSKPGTTGVFYMGRRNLGSIVARLLEMGRSPETPVAMVEWGTHSRQRTLVSTLAAVEADADREAIQAPCITAVGEVVSLRPEMAWFDRRPLFGKKVLVTRARAQASSLVHLLEEAGAEVLEAPTIEIAPPEDSEALARGIARLEEAKWLLFTSQNAVHAWFQALAKAGKDTRALAGLEIVSMGPATTRSLQEHGIQPDWIPEESRAEGVLALLEGKTRPQELVLFPRAQEAREVLPEGLRSWGLEVEILEAYQTRRVDPGPEIEAALRAGEIDWVTWTSASTVENFHAAFSALPEAKELRSVSIGPITSKKARELGYEVTLEAPRARVEALAEVLIQSTQRAPCA